MPTLLLLGGVGLGLLLALVGKAVANGSAVVRRKRAESRLRSAIEKVADELMIAPLEAELGRHQRGREALERARTG